MLIPSTDTVVRNGPAASRGRRVAREEIPSVLVVSNRLPVVVSPGERGGWTLEPGSGGLVTALEPVLRRAGGTWIGWPGTNGGGGGAVKHLLDEDTSRGYRLGTVPLSAEEREGFYLGFSNQIIWPLFHGFPERCVFRPRYWEVYRRVTRRFAEAVAERIRGRELIWIHDYHLMGVAEALGRRASGRPLAFFLHTPVPCPDMLRKLPWCRELLRSLMHYDLIGLQAERDRRNLLQSLRALLPEYRIRRSGELHRIRGGGGVTRVGVFPISIDASEFSEQAMRDPVRRRALWLRNGAGTASPAGDPASSPMILLGVDRLDYTKGLPHKLEAFRLALRRYPHLRGRVTLVQLVVPSREAIPAYGSLKRKIERLVGEICGEFNEAGWCPIRYEYGRWDRETLVAHYRAARAALVTPLKDGMNLVAKEYCAANVDRDGVLVLSEHAGAAEQLGAGALIVNPYDVEALAAAIHRACTMPRPERVARMERLRAGVHRHDIHRWAEGFLATARRASTREPGGWTNSGRPHRIGANAARSSNLPAPSPRPTARRYEISRGER